MRWVVLCSVDVNIMPLHGRDVMRVSCGERGRTVRARARARSVGDGSFHLACACAFMSVTACEGMVEGMPILQWFKWACSQVVLFVVLCANGVCGNTPHSMHEHLCLLITVP
jgi:hypothetical protein